jgi:16S rRNA (guanine966-N2)-methyltransferase
MSALQFALPGARVLDLFAGSGALGLEALSRGAARVTFVERAAPALRALASNIEQLGAGGEVDVVRADALGFVAGVTPGSYELALADPPYGKGLAAALVQQFGRRPFADWLWVEHRRDDELPDLPAAHTRRYGDTLLTSIPAEP